jgi:hypothetical protein
MGNKNPCKRLIFEPMTRHDIDPDQTPPTMQAMPRTMLQAAAPSRETEGAAQAVISFSGPTF